MGTKTQTACMFVCVCMRVCVFCVCLLCALMCVRDANSENTYSRNMVSQELQRSEIVHSIRRLSRCVIIIILVRLLVLFVFLTVQVHTNYLCEITHQTRYIGPAIV